MLSRRTEGKEEQVEYVVMSKLVPEDHLLRKVKKALDFDFIYELVKDKYSLETGRPSVDPVVLIKIVLIQYLFGIRSMRQTIREIEVNAAYRWFLGMGWQDEVPHFSTFGKNYKRRFEGTDLFEQIFAHILEQCYRRGYVRDDMVFADGTHIKARANKNKTAKVLVEKEAAVFARELAEEIDRDREWEGKKPFSKKDEDDGDKGGGNAGKLAEVTQSTTDPESGLFVKGEHERVFAYEAQTLCDRRGFVLAYDVVSGNVHDSRSFWGIYGQIQRIKPKYAALDAAYKTPAICKALLECGVIPAMPYTRPKTKKGFFKKEAYRYLRELDCFSCPGGELLHYSTTNREGYREYKSCGAHCRDCGCRGQCTNSQNCQKTITRHLWQDYVDAVDALRHDPDVKDVYKRRKQTIERVFADGKEKHGLRCTQYRGLAKVRMQVGLIFACMNLKKLATWSWKEPCNPFFSPLFASLAFLFPSLVQKGLQTPA